MPRRAGHLTLEARATIADMSRKTLLTADELEQMPDDDSVQIELDEGELVAMPPTAMDHAHFESEIAAILRAFVKKHRLGRAYTGEPGFRLSPDTVHAPEVAFIRQERLSQITARVSAAAHPTSLLRSSRLPIPSAS